MTSSLMLRRINYWSSTEKINFLSLIYKKKKLITQSYIFIILSILLNISLKCCYYQLMKGSFSGFIGIKSVSESGYCEKFEVSKAFLSNVLLYFIFGTYGASIVIKSNPLQSNPLNHRWSIMSLTPSFKQPYLFVTSASNKCLISDLASLLFYNMNTSLRF